MTTISTTDRFKDFLKSIPGVGVILYIIDDFLHGIRTLIGTNVSISGSTHVQFSPEESVAYIEEVFDSYKKYGKFDKFFGRVAEVGPGDNAGVAMLIRKDGSTQVDLIDRFLSYRNPQQQKEIYEALAQKYNLEHLRAKNEWGEQALDSITWKVGQASEEYFKDCAQKQGEVYDFIISRAVLEHLYDPLSALRSMTNCLKPNGLLLHKVDFRDHGMFSALSHELTFLQVPGNVYPLMVKNSARPNRILIHLYREVLDSMKRDGLIDYSILVTNLVDVGNINPHKLFDDIDLDKQHKSIKFVEKHRHKFAKEFKNVDSKDLAVSGIFLVVTKK
ncbi:MAG: class I SAM-dependent methyltransferase [Scytonematopsis contorta HA4267-MV1]|jgi:SAM-dependent methyltransferase|nr:class I SAM-dependent methyltransferase [Scytonematopsis contorta HA4267-MV1]